MRIHEGNSARHPDTVPSFLRRRTSLLSFPPSPSYGNPGSGAGTGTAFYGRDSSFASNVCFPSDSGSRPYGPVITRIIRPENQLEQRFIHRERGLVLRKHWRRREPHPIHANHKIPRHFLSGPKQKDLLQDPGRAFARTNLTGGPTRLTAAPDGVPLIRPASPPYRRRHSS